VAGGAFVSPALTNDLAIEAEHRTTKRYYLCFTLIPGSADRVHDFLPEESLQDGARLPPSSNAVYLSLVPARHDEGIFIAKDLVC
jgi:hypothetical protein